MEINSTVFNLVTTAPRPIAPLQWDQHWHINVPDFAKQLADLRTCAMQSLFQATNQTDIDLACALFAYEALSAYASKLSKVVTTLEQQKLGGKSVPLRTIPPKVEWVYPSDKSKRTNFHGTQTKYHYSVVTNSLPAIEAINVLVAAICIMFQAALKHEQISGVLQNQNFAAIYQKLYVACNLLESFYPGQTNPLLSTAQYNSLLYDNLPLQLHRNWVTYARVNFYLRWQLYYSVETDDLRLMRGLYKLSSCRHELVLFWLQHTNIEHDAIQNHVAILNNMYEASLLQNTQFKAQIIMHEISRLLEPTNISDTINTDRNYLGRLLQTLREAWNTLKELKAPVNVQAEHWYAEAYKHQQRLNLTVCSPEALLSWQQSKPYIVCKPGHTPY